MFKKQSRNFTEGPMFWRITAFAIPLMLTGILQICYNMADNIVVGQFSGDPYALGAVGSTSSFSNLILTLLLGMSIGAGVIVAQAYGAKNDGMLSSTVHTALTFALFGGIAFMLIGLVISAPVLRLMGIKEVFFDKSLLYLRIICLGIPASSVYNFGASVLRSVGNSKTPLYILATSGLLNVGLNLVFVIGCHMTVAGVALATIISQYASATAVVIILALHKNDSYGFSFKKYRFDCGILFRMIRLGIPAGIQSAMFSISNMLLASSVNTLKDTAVTAYAISNSIDSIAYTCGNCFCVACTTFSGQNYGAGKPERIKKALFYSLIQAVITVFVIGQIVLFFGEPISKLFVDATNPARDEIISEVMNLISMLLTLYFLCAVMECFSGLLRALGYSLLPMANSIIGICGTRILWVFIFFPMERFNTLRGMFICYPISWSFAALLQIIACIFAWKKLKKAFCSQKSNKESFKV